MKAFEFVGGPNDGEHTTFDGPVPREVLIQTVMLEPAVVGDGFTHVGPLPPNARYLLDPVAEVYRYTPAVKEPAWRSGWTGVGMHVGFTTAVIIFVWPRSGVAALAAYFGCYLALAVPLRWLPEWMR